MKIETKTNLNKEVYIISSSAKQKLINCPRCSGQGKFKWPNGDIQSCGQCFGSGEIKKFDNPSWHISGCFSVGRITVEVQSIKGSKVISNYGEFDPDNIEVVEKVMCYESGIGSGTVYTIGEHAFISRKEAEAECSELNSKA